MAVALYIIEITGDYRFSRQRLENLWIGPGTVKCTHLPKIRSTKTTAELACQIPRQLFDSLLAIVSALLPALCKLYDPSPNVPIYGRP